ncbi:hypothetical protein FH972_013023 [Carpinus fangiana]|uniref:Peptidase A1 domain-containing protein n=1 Tax=Carpinus fangiana TaxID=176857 RepID=A0A5N6R741_9ROSI|nr:hypothetical protein FH972_013023 [Carpinus fangiana]
MGSGKIVALVLMMSMIAYMVVGDEDNENCNRDVFNECVGRRDPNRKASLKVVHKYGPCSQLYQDKAKTPTHVEILLQGKLRVKSIHSKLSKKLAAGSGGNLRDLKDSMNIPTKFGSTVGTGNYVVTFSIGTPKKKLTLIFDTSSDLTWTQCEPCAGSCYNQTETIFDPSTSNTHNALNKHCL